jgi:hypothetical protein
MAASIEGNAVNDPSMPCPNWTPENVVRAIRRSLGLVALSYTPYFSELFDDRLIGRIKHPADIDFDPARVARPWLIEAAGKRYFVPGSAQDLIHYTSCVIACCPQIKHAWELTGPDADNGPPAQDELALGRIGERPWKHYWNEFHRRSGSIANSGYPWVLNADIESCAAMIDGEGLAELLSEWGSDPDAVRIFAAMHRAWHHFGFSGLPVTGTFSLLNRAYLMEVEQCLHGRGIVFLRSVDDFRLFCKTPAEQESMRLAIRNCLATRRLRLNESKTRFEQFGGPRSTSRCWRLIIRGKARYGLIRPALVRLTACRVLRPFCLSMLWALVSRPAKGAQGELKQ